MSKKAKALAKQHYERKVFYHKPDKCWIAIAPELPGCSAGGDTAEEALAELGIAMEGWLSTAKKYGHRIPAPIADKDLSGRILLRLPKSLHKELLEEAMEEGVSLNQYALLVIAGRKRTTAPSGAKKFAYAAVQNFPAIVAEGPREARKKER